MSNEDVVLRVIGEVLAEKGVILDTLADNAALADDLGMDSLDMATAVARLDEELGIDPFAEDSPEFATVAEFVALYGET